MRRWTASFAALAVVGLFALAAYAADTPKEGSKAPDIDLPATQLDKVTPGAKTLKLSDLRGKKNIVILFAFAPPI